MEKALIWIKPRSRIGANPFARLAAPRGGLEGGRMNILVPLASLIGPVYFGFRDWAAGYVVAWSIVWQALRVIATRKDMLAELKRGEGERTGSWISNPAVAFIGVVVAATAATLAVHLGVYGLIRLVAGRS
jgi:hypothetical protein